MEKLKKRVFITMVIIVTLVGLIAIAAVLADLHQTYIETHNY